MDGIFISYRGNDVAEQVGRLFEHLAGHYGEDFVFMDVHRSETCGWRCRSTVRLRGCCSSGS